MEVRHQSSVDTNQERGRPARQFLGLVVSFLVCFSAAALGSLLTSLHVQGWYAGLTKPWWTPPNWIFGPVWSILYA